MNEQTKLINSYRRAHERQEERTAAQAERIAGLERERDAATERAERAEAEVERLRGAVRDTSTPFEHDPFVDCAVVFEELFPNAPVLCRIVEGLHKQDGDPWGEAWIPDDDDMESVPIISIDVDATIRGAVELLMHEYAHVAVHSLGLSDDEPHGPYWQDVFDKLHAGYCERVEALCRQPAAQPETQKSQETKS